MAQLDDGLMTDTVVAAYLLLSQICQKKAHESAND
jgi:hypothetical protein